MANVEKHHYHGVARFQCEINDPRCPICSAKETKPSYRVEVVADSTGNWVGNALVFVDLEEAKQYAIDLFSRWTAVREWRVIDDAGNPVAGSE